MIIAEFDNGGCNDSADLEKFRLREVQGFLIEPSEWLGLEDLIVNKYTSQRRAVVESYLLDACMYGSFLSMWLWM